MSGQWSLACRQWQGARPRQEDAFGTLQIEAAGDGEASSLLMVLADGMGGAAGGAEASQAVVDVFVREFPKVRGRTGYRLRKCLGAATASLRDHETVNPRFKGMGSTVVAALYDGHDLDWLSVGDSPMWLFTGGTLERLNANHSIRSVLGGLVRTGKLSLEDARSDWKRNMFRSVVGGRAPEFVDCGSRSHRFQKGEYLLIASDGVEALSDDEIA